MAIVRGESVLLKFYNGSEYLPFACARAISLEMKSELIGKSTVGSGSWKEKEVSALDWSFTLEGIMYLNREGMTDTTSIIDVWLSKLPVQVQFIITSDEYDEIQLTGDALIVSVSPQGSVNNVGSLSVQGEGTGLLTKVVDYNFFLMDSDRVFITDTDGQLIRFIN